MREDDLFHPAAVGFLDDTEEELVTTPLAVTEMDHLVTSHGGAGARDDLWLSLEEGAYAVRWWADGLAESLAIARTRPRLGLVDASLIALADRLGADRVFSFDQHFDGHVTPKGRTLIRVPERTP